MSAIRNGPAQRCRALSLASVLRDDGKGKSTLRHIRQTRERSAWAQGSANSMAGIARVEVGRFDYELVGEFKFFKTPFRPSIVVRLTDENGVHGWGQSVPIETWTYETVESVEITLRHYLASVVLGVEPSDLAAIHQRMDRAIKPSFSVGQPLCKAAIDLACY